MGEVASLSFEVQIRLAAVTPAIDDFCRAP